MHFDRIKEKKIKMSLGLKEIRKSAFKDCFALEKVDLPQIASKISKSAFSGCERLCEVNLIDVFRCRIDSLDEHFLCQIKQGAVFVKPEDEFLSLNAFIK